MKKLVGKYKAFWWATKLAFARLYYGNPSKKLKIIGVTGTNGKTTTTTESIGGTTPTVGQQIIEGNKSGLFGFDNNFSGTLYFMLHF